MRSHVAGHTVVDASRASQKSGFDALAWLYLAAEKSSRPYVQAAVMPAAQRIDYQGEVIEDEARSTYPFSAP